MLPSSTTEKLLSAHVSTNRQAGDGCQSFFIQMFMLSNVIARFFLIWKILCNFSRRETFMCVWQHVNKLILLPANSRVGRSAKLVSARQPNVYVMSAQDVTLNPGDGFLKNQYREIIVVNRRLHCSRSASVLKRESSGFGGLHEYWV